MMKSMCKYRMFPAKSSVISCGHGAGILLVPIDNRVVGSRRWENKEIPKREECWVYRNEERECLERTKTGFKGGREFGHVKKKGGGSASL